ncbi:c-type cytochrome biogenesis protein CcsB [Tsukamurella sp. 8F]|uniref:c-type cytochrome biogenesis protein CcsB n=1 Tax=unclassified Tsukamurella TaxID=2633480 RepID=UPI0023BA1769|nr:MULTISPECIES: c-type cytochrome biogenesis protein CcsB [unclassified Tsukamurella]MDF0531660.1 c-type cytochrome biogenesis protein CcsB [Tsukamurella sp. 8J]MDF0588772.1 c-type cytochrome biogenesis protein CcsB [Tsukamurella sp. 8F]
MDINLTLSHYSDHFFASACAVYAVCLVLLVVELAGTRVQKLVAKDEARELVGAGGPVATASSPGIVVDERRDRSIGERLGRMGYAVLVAGLLLHISSIVLRGMATHRWPWGNMYEFVTITCAGAVVVGLIALRKPENRPVLVFVLTPVLILLGIAGKWLYTDAGPVVPSLKSYWLAIHVTIVSIGSGIFLVSGAASLLFLWRRRYDGRELPSGILGNVLSRLPSTQQLDRIAYATVIVAFPLFSAGVICGAIWAESAWGRFWGWDPKETVSFIAWVVYAAYLHARATAGWKNSRAAWINIAGFVAMIFNLFVINYVVSGLHSYAG